MKQSSKDWLKGGQMIPQLLQEFHPSRLLSSLSAGMVIGVVGVTMSISYAALIFADNLSSYLSIGIGIALFSATIICLLVAVMSSSPVGIIAMPLPPTVAILALMATSINNSMPASAKAAEVFSTVVCAIALTSILNGIFFLAVGWLKVGGLIRFIPYPVVGGFLAGIGWLLFKGGIKVTTNIGLTWVKLPVLFHSDIVLRWLPGLIFAVVLLLILRRYKHFLIMPVSLLIAIGLFYVILFLTHTSIAQVSSQGWLLGPFPENSSWHPLRFSTLTQANWSVVFNQIGSMGTILVLNTLQLLLTATGLELLTQRDIDLNRELQAAGVANLASGFGGGMVGCHLTSLCILACKIGAKSRLAAIFTAGVFAAVLVLGLSLLSFFPKLVIGGLLLFLGLDLLVQWIYDSWFKLPRTDYLIVLLILVVIGASGFLEGVAVGLVVAIILFVINYSRISVTKHALSGANYSSHVQRPQNQELLLRQKGEQIYILELQGLIFFGTANKLLNQIRQRLGDPNRESLRFVVLDFRLVSGLDSSAVLSFVKLKQIAQKQQITLVFTNLPPGQEKQLRQGGALEKENIICKVFPDLDQGMEWCENQILETAKWRRQRFLPLAMQLKNLFANAKEVSAFISYLEKVQLSEGEYLFRQGDDPESLYFVESGQVSTLVELDNGQTRRVQTLGAGTIVGEIAFYNKTPHQTCAIAQQLTKLYRLGVNDLQRMQQENPQAADAFKEFIISLLADRLAYAHNQIENLLN